MNPLIQLKRTTPAFLIALLIVCPGLSPKAQAVSPPPDGGYPNQNTAEGDNSLFSLTTGTDNTAIGFNALVNNTSGGFNTATGVSALESNTDGGGNTANGVQALQNNTTGNNNTACGRDALFSNSTGIGNIALGANAGNALTTDSHQYRYRQRRCCRRVQYHSYRQGENSKGHLCLWHQWSDCAGRRGSYYRY